MHDFLQFILIIFVTGVFGVVVLWAFRRFKILRRILKHDKVASAFIVALLGNVLDTFKVEGRNKSAIIDVTKFALDFVLDAQDGLEKDEIVNFMNNILDQYDVDIKNRDVIVNTIADALVKVYDFIGF